MSTQGPSQNFSQSPSDDVLEYLKAEFLKYNNVNHKLRTEAAIGLILIVIANELSVLNMQISTLLHATQEETTRQ